MPHGPLPPSTLTPSQQTPQQTPHPIPACPQPTFAFYKGPQRVESFTGARADLLKATIDKLSK